VHYGHNITRAAEALGIAKSTFYRKMGEYGLP
jgi:transcriptional regulator of acetoin/glycerol metabolism